MSGRFLRSACTAALAGALALTLRAPSVLADPGPESPPGASGRGTPGEGTPHTGNPATGVPPTGTPPPGTTETPGTGTSGTGTTDTGTSDTGTSDTGSTDTGEGELARVTEGADTGGAEAGARTTGRPTPSRAPAPSSGGPTPDRGTAVRSVGAPTGGTGTDTAAVPGPAALLKKLQTLYRETEKSTAAYKATLANLRRAQTRARTVTAQLVRARAELAGGRADAGRLARLQYQGRTSAQLSPSLWVLLAKNPRQAMDRTHYLQEASGDQAATVARLTTAEKQAAALAARDRAALGTQQRLTVRTRTQYLIVRRRLEEVEKLLASLSAEQLTALSRLDAARGDRPADGGPAPAYGLGQAGQTHQAAQAGPPGRTGQAEQPG